MSFGKYKIRESIGNIETHEVFLDTLAKTKEEQFGLTEKRLEVKIKERIILVIFGIFFVIVSIFLGKTFYLQVIQGKKLYLASQSNKGKMSLIRPERGIVYDKNFKKLVTNSPAYDLVCDKRNFSVSSESSLQEVAVLADLLQKPVEEIETLIGDSNEGKVVVAENVSHEQLLILEARLNEISDCQIEKNTVRNYVMGPVFSHVLGYTGRVTKDNLEVLENYSSSDYIGKDGLEKSYEAELRGIPGITEVVKTATGVKKEDKVVSEPTPGYNLVLNIDANLQKRVYDSLEKSIKNLGSKKGAAVALNPQTGAILALVSYPSYDDNMFSQGISKEDFNAIINDTNQPFFNRVISAQYPTGSTIKPFLAMGALEENIISPTKLINDIGYILVHSQYDPSVSYKFAGVVPHGWVDMKKAIAVSSNVYFYTVGGGYENQQGLGPTRIKKYLDLFGWEQKTGIDLPQEFKGFVPGPDWKKKVKKENWWDGDTYNLSIGQSDLQVTPLQVAVAYSYIANGGTMYKPQVVQKIVDGSGKDAKVVKEFAPEIISKNFIDPKNLKIVREGMRDGVQKDYGSSYMLNDLPVAVAGKTGTAETNKAGFYNTWSASFAPYDNPEIVFVTTIEGVQGLRAATLPVAHDVLQYFFQGRSKK
jgi:penicillin-binding protein 2